MLRILQAIVCCLIAAKASYGQLKFEPIPHWNADRNENIFPYGKLTELDQQSLPAGWDEVSAFKSGKAVMLAHPELLLFPKGIFRLKCGEDGSKTSVSTTIDLPESNEYVTILARMSGAEVEPGDSDDAGAGLVFTLESEDGKQIATSPRMQPEYRYSNSLGGWLIFRSTLKTPWYYSKLKISAEIVDSKGVFELDKVLVIPSVPGYQATPEQMQELRRAIQIDDSKKVATLLKETPQLLNYRDGSGSNRTPLIYAVCCQSTAVIKELIRLGADLEATDDSYLKGPLGYCCLNGYPEIAEILIEAGAQTKRLANLARNSKKRYGNESSEEYDRVADLILKAQEAQSELDQ